MERPASKYQFCRCGPTLINEIPELAREVNPVCMVIMAHRRGKVSMPEHSRSEPPAIRHGFPDLGCDIVAKAVDRDTNTELSQGHIAGEAPDLLFCDPV